MRFISPFLLAIFIFSCNSKNSVMTEKEFAQAYYDALSKKFPNVHFEISPDLTIKSKEGELESNHYIDNAYLAYKAEPDSINAILSRYVASSADLYSGLKVVNVENIFPVIKPLDYLEQINSLKKDGGSFPMITENYNDQLIIVYAEDSKNSIRFLTDNDLKTISISLDTLKALAIRNFEKIIPNIEIRGDNGLYMVTAGGDYEASLILLTSLWTKENFPVDGEFIIAIPNRDMLLVTGSNNKTGINKIKEIAIESYKSGSYPISDNLYKWNGKYFKTQKGPS